MGVRRWLRRKLAGVEDPARGAAGHTDPRHFVQYTIENAPFQRWVVFVAAVGFLTDAYDIFALNVVSQIVPWIYWQQNGNPGAQYQAALLCSTLAGALLGQITFGFLGDMYGRRKMYGLELIVLIVGSVGTAMASTGSHDSMSFIGWLIFWRVFMGYGIGGDYPISAVITSEFAPRKHRARMLAFVFWMQAVGQVLVYAIALAVIAAYEPQLSVCNLVEHQNGALSLDPSNEDQCLQNLDKTWRWVVGLGAVPAAVAIFFRLTIPQSPRYLMDVADNVDRAVQDTEAYYGSAEIPVEMQRSQTAPLAYSNQNDTAQWNHATSEAPMSTFKHSGASEDIQSAQHEVSSRPVSPASSAPSSVPSIMPTRVARGSVAQSEQQYCQSWWGEFRDYFFHQRNWSLLAGTAGAWFLLDIPFYGIELSSAGLINAIWDSSTQVSQAPQPSPTSYQLYDALVTTFWRELVLTGTGALAGGAAFIKLIKHVSPKTMQVWGFAVLTVLLLVTGVVLIASNTGTSAVIFLYVLIQLNFSLGPNTTTYLIPAELFPTRFRCTCHGLSAAAGRLGGIVAQLIVTLSPFGQALVRVSPGSDPSQTLGRLFAVLCIFPALGTGLTWWLTPETRDKHGNPRSLETLAKGYEHLKKLGREADPEDRED